MRRQNPDEYTDGEHGWVDGKCHRLKDVTGDLNEATWQDYRASLAERFIAANNPLWKMPPERPASVPREWRTSNPPLTEHAWNHILYGDRKRDKNKEWEYEGGYLSGYGWIADRTEFPTEWDPETILSIVKETLQDGTKVEPTEFRSMAISHKDGLKIKVVYTKKKGVISMYVDEKG